MPITRRSDEYNVAADLGANLLLWVSCFGAALQLILVQSETMHSRDTLRLDELKIANYQWNSFTHCGEPCAQFVFGLSAIAMLVTTLQQSEHPDCTDQRRTRRPVQVVESVLHLLGRWEREPVQPVENAVLIAFVGCKNGFTTRLTEQPQKMRQQLGIAGYLHGDLHEHQQALGLVSVCLLLCLGACDLHRDGARTICCLAKPVGDKSQNGCRHNSGNTGCCGPSAPIRQASFAQPPART